MRIFITGTTGFLGSHTAQELVRRGHRLKALVRNPAAAAGLKALGVELVEGALEDPPDLGQAMDGVEAVVHIAGVLKGLGERDFFQVNEDGTLRLAQAALSLNPRPRLFLYVSTVAVHDSTRDGGDFCLPPEACHPLSVYGKSKLAGEKVLSVLKGNIRTVILRPPVIYGPGDKELLPLFRAIRWGVAPLYGNGQNRLSVCHVSEVARAIADLVENSPSSDEIFCVDDGQEHTWKSLAQDIGRAMNKNPWPLKIPPFFFFLAASSSGAFAQLTRRPRIFTPDKLKEMAQKSWVCGFEKLHNRIGWEPGLPFKEGVLTTLAFYKKVGWL